MSRPFVAGLAGIVACILWLSSSHAQGLSQIFRSIQVGDPAAGSQLSSSVASFAGPGGAAASVVESKTKNEIFLHAGESSLILGTIGKAALEIYANLATAARISPEGELWLAGVSGDGEGRVLCVKKDGNIGSCDSKKSKCSCE